MRVDFKRRFGGNACLGIARRLPGFSISSLTLALALFAAPAKAQTTADTIQSIQAQAQLAARDALKAPCDTDISEYVNKLWVYRRQLETMRNSLESQKDDLNKKAIDKLKQLSDLIPQFGGGAGEEFAKDPAKGVAVDAVKDTAKDAIKKGIEKQMGKEIVEKVGEQFAGGVVEGLAKGIDAAKVAKDLMEKMDIDIAREGIITDAVNLELQIQLRQLYENMAKAALKAVDDLIAKLDTKEKCPPPGTATGIGTNSQVGGTTPTTPGPRVATGLWGGTGASTGVGGTDGPTWCGYGPGTPGLFPYLPMDSFTPPPDPQQPAGGPTFPGGTPDSQPVTPTTPADGPKIAGGPPITPTTPGGDPKQPRTPTTPTTPTGGTPITPTTPTGDTPKTPTTPTTPTPTPTTPTTPQPTPTTTPDPVPTTPPVTIFVKANESVLQGGQPGNPIAGQNVALFTPKPALPVFGPNDFGPTGNDYGFNRDPARCTTGGNGGCNINIPQDERPMFGLPDTPANMFGMNVEPQKVNGGYLTGNGPVPNVTPFLPNGVTPLFGDPFSVNGETFTPVFFNFPSNVPFEVNNLTSQIPNLLVDFCFDKQPGPPLGAEPTNYSALNQELPNASVTIDRIRRSMRGTSPRRTSR